MNCCSASRARGSNRPSQTWYGGISIWSCHVAAQGRGSRRGAGGRPKRLRRSGPQSLAVRSGRMKWLPVPPNRRGFSQPGGKPLAVCSPRLITAGWTIRDSCEFPSQPCPNLANSVVLNHFLRAWRGEPARRKLRKFAAQCAHQKPETVSRFTKNLPDG